MNILRELFARIKSTIVDVNAPDTEMTNALEPPETTKIGDNASDIKMMTTIDDDALEPNTTKDDVDASELSTTAVDGNASDTEMTPIVDEKEFTDDVIDLETSEVNNKKNSMKFLGQQRIKSTIVDVNAPDTEMTNALEPPETTKIGDNASDIKMMTTIDDDALEPNTTKDDVDASELSTTAVDGNASDTEMTPIVDGNVSEPKQQPQQQQMIMLLPRKGIY
ncbi:hypothetical protein Glove_19g376 [Diversispora epigaea]|uniref:Uncharacterized protein n=1 Tax=Diversispora epigaea TaxID=1348612 RepID=A0A397JLX3_9GLOM|nr:hypothetical protein Glove_19g376 [Diversispora epigaea]